MNLLIPQRISAISPQKSMIFIPDQRVIAIFAAMPMAINATNAITAAAKVNLIILVSKSIMLLPFNSK